MQKLSVAAILAVLVACAPAAEEMPPPAAGDGTSDSASSGTHDLDPGVTSAPGGRFAEPPPGAPAEPPLAVPAEPGWHTEAEPGAAVPLPSGADRRGRPGPVPGPQTRFDAPPEAGFDAPAQAEASAPALASSIDATAPAPAASSSRSAKARRSKGRSASKSARPSSGGARALAPQPMPEERPGLGTSWGETRYSSVSEVPFVRDTRKPSYTATMHYNDESGARALAGHHLRGAGANVNLSSALTVSLYDEYGGLMSAYRGNGRTVAVGRHGQRYSLVVQNRTNERFEVVVSVDGLDVLDGRDASFAKRGYLIEPYGTIEIEGFRKSNDAVAAFRFGAVKDSYAALTGSDRNVGVIGVAAFGERGYLARLRAYRARIATQRRFNREVVRRQHADPFPNRYANPPLHLAR